jgi:hypothetical protein
MGLNLDYTIHQRQLQGKNQFIIDQLTLGEKVVSPEAKDLPLDLAIALLQDTDGRIDLDLPVSGNLDDPKFSYGGLIWKAIFNVFTKIVTSPFRMLGALFGGNEKVENIAFEAGKVKLTPPEREKMTKIATALNKRPGLALSLHGVYAEQDKTALQERKLRLDVAAATGQPVEDSEDPGPLPTRSPKVQTALETLYADRFSGGELTSLKEGFRLANPGQLTESLKGKMMSKLTGMFQNKKPLTEQEIAQLKGGDFYRILADRLRSGITIEDKQLLRLATERGESLYELMKTAGAPMERVTLQSAEKVIGEGRDIPVKLVLGAATKSTTPLPASGVTGN